MAEPLTLGAILCEARRRYGWTLRDAERATGIPNAHISQLETGAIAAPGITVLVKLAKAYALPLRRLLDVAGQGADWALVTEASEAEIRADERQRIENAITWNTSCLSCATVLDSCYAETVRREQAEEKLAAVRSLAERLGDARLLEILDGKS